MSLNKAMLIGNVGKDPEVRYIETDSTGSQNQSGQYTGTTKRASFPLATTDRYRDRSGNIRETTEWHNIVVWRGNADVVEKFVRKGTQLYVEGKIRSRSWEDQSGNKRYTTEIIADTIQLLGKRQDNPASDGAVSEQDIDRSGTQAQEQNHPPVQNQAPSGLQTRQPAVQEDDDDDLPF